MLTVKSTKVCVLQETDERVCQEHLQESYDDRGLEAEVGLEILYHATDARAASFLMSNSCSSGDGGYHGEPLFPACNSAAC